MIQCTYLHPACLYYAARQGDVHSQWGEITRLGQAGVYKLREWRDLDLCWTWPVYSQQMETECRRHTNIYESLSRLTTANLRKVTKSFFILIYCTLDETGEYFTLRKKTKKNPLATGKIKRFECNELMFIRGFHSSWVLCITMSHCWLYA